MTIISISLPDENVGSLERIQKYLGLSGRSEAVRASIKIAETEVREMEKLEGEVEGVLIVVHSKHNDHWISMLQHRYDYMIKTQLHSHLQNRKCLEVMILSSDAVKLEEMMREIYKTGKAEYVKFVRSR
ncbi:MAG: CopG family transcriptional regulator [Methanomassiliicoccaceae archaeon]|nr:CopG family transcriptional regulator [Methanomassiliicoccaceae archaeon]